MMEDGKSGAHPWRIGADRGDPTGPADHADPDSAVSVDPAPWAPRVRLDELRLSDHRVPGAALLAAEQAWRGDPVEADPEQHDRGVMRPATWVHCSPALLNAGVHCGSCPRRACACDFTGSHDHLVDDGWLRWS